MAWRKYPPNIIEISQEVRTQLLEHLKHLDEMMKDHVNLYQYKPSGLEFEINDVKNEIRFWRDLSLPDPNQSRLTENGKTET
jgi:hypothetical protein